MFILYQNKVHEVTVESNALVRGEITYTIKAVHGKPFEDAFWQTDITEDGHTAYTLAKVLYNTPEDAEEALGRGDDVKADDLRSELLGL